MRGDRRQAAAPDGRHCRSQRPQGGGGVSQVRGLCGRRLVAQHGLDLVLEPINGRNMPGYFLNDFAFAENLIAS